MQNDWLWEVFLPNLPPPHGLTILRKFSLTISAIQLHSFCLLVKTSCLLPENLNGTLFVKLRGKFCLAEVQH